MKHLIPLAFLCLPLLAQPTASRAYSVTITTDVHRLPSASDVENSVRRLSNLNPDEWQVRARQISSIRRWRHHEESRIYSVRIGSYREVLPTPTRVGDAIQRDAAEGLYRVRVTR